MGLSEALLITAGLCLWIALLRILQKAQQQ